MALGSWVNPARGRLTFWSVRVRMLSGTGTWVGPSPGPSTAPAISPPVLAGDTPPSASRALDLMPLVELPAAVVAGTWRRADAAGPSAGGGPALVAETTGGQALWDVPYEPPVEYDFAIEFTPKTGTVALIMPKRLPGGGGTSFAWYMGLGDAHSTCGLERLHGLDATADGNPTRRTAPLAAGARHRAVVQVRNGSVTAWLDGSLVTQHRTDYRDLARPRDWRLRDERHLGVGNWGAPCVIHKIELVDVAAPAGGAGGQADKGVDVLRLIDPPRDVVQGVWSQPAGELQSDAGRPSSNCPWPSRPSTTSAPSSCTPAAGPSSPSG